MRNAPAVSAGRRGRCRRRSRIPAEPPTYVFLGEGPGEAQVPGHLGLEQPVLPEVGVQAVRRRGNLEERKDFGVRFFLR